MNLKQWVVQKTLAVPLQFSLRHQFCYFAIEIEAPENFREFFKYYEKNLRGRAVVVLMARGLPQDGQIAGMVHINVLKFGSVKKIDKLMRIIIWTDASHFRSEASVEIDTKDIINKLRTSRGYTR